jgi:ribulose-phosphate 3-epimerase
MSREYFQMEPSMIAADWGRMEEEAKSCIDAGAEALHIDVMDGLFVPNFAVGPDLVAAIKRAVPKAVLDLHLMIYSPESYIERFIQVGADEITFHLEATEEVDYTIDYIRKCGKSPGLAIKPETSVSLILKYLAKVDKVLIMTVEPGFGGQAFMPEMLEKVKFLREQVKANSLKTVIQVDGGVSLETGRQCVKAGANNLVCGSYFFKQKNRNDVVKQFKELCEKESVR